MTRSCLVRQKQKPHYPHVLSGDGNWTKGSALFEKTTEDTTREEWSFIFLILYYISKLIVPEAVKELATSFLHTSARFLGSLLRGAFVSFLPSKRENAGG